MSSGCLNERMTASRISAAVGTHHSPLGAQRCGSNAGFVCIEQMTIQRMEHVGVVVDDLAASTGFFIELGLELEGEAPVEGRW